MKKIFTLIILSFFVLAMNAQERRPIDSKHPAWLIHVDVWNKADPQKIINLIPEDVRPYVIMNLSLSCQYDTERNVYKMPENAVKTYKSWGSVCQQNGMWFTCQPASGGHTHIQDDDLETFEYFYKRFPNFLGWNYAEQFWGFDEPNDKSSSSQASRIALFAKLVPMAHKYGGFLTVSFCGNIWSHPLNPVGMMKRNKDLLAACKEYPEAMLWLYKYTTSSCFYNNESVTWSPFVSGLAKNYGVRYDNCGWNGALDAILGEKHGKKYPVAAGIGTVMEQTCVNGGAVWDGPELIWTEDFQNLNNSTVDGYTRRNWGTFPGFDNAWIDMFRKIIDGTLYIPSREEVVEKTKVFVLNNVTNGNDEQKYAAWGDLYNGLYKMDDPFNKGDGTWMNNYCYFKKTGRYGAIPVGVNYLDDLAKNIPLQIKKASYTTQWSSQAKKVDQLNKYYPEVSTGDMYVNRYRNQLVTYNPHTYMKKVHTYGNIPLQYNTCDSLLLDYACLSSGLVREYADHIDFYLNNYRTDTTTAVIDKITIVGATAEPTYTFKKRGKAVATVTAEYNAETSHYILSVKHMGPVDITINCSGNATDRLTDAIEQKSLADDLPKQPEPYKGAITIEAEDMDFKSIKSCVTDPYGWYPNVHGHAGNGFMDMGTNTAGALKHVIKVAEGGDYRISVRYNNTSRNANLAATINSGSRKTLNCPKTGANQWNIVSFNATLKAGNNTLMIANAGGVSMYIDNVTYTPAGVEDEKYGITFRNMEHGNVVADVDSAKEGEKVTLTVIPDEGYILSGWTIVHGKITIADDNTFIMPDDNVTLSPVFMDKSVVYNLDFSKVLAGTIPAGWRCIQENNDVHEYPNSYSSGSRTFDGFTGYQGKALYWREGYAEYGKQKAYPLTLEPGSYKLTYATAAWKEAPKYSVQILDASGNEIASVASNFALPNAGGSSAATVTSSKEYTLDFDIATKGDYIIRFTNLDKVAGFDEFLLLECKINAMSDPSAISAPSDNFINAPRGIYSITGAKQTSLQKGINIIRLQDGTTKKIFVK